MSLKKTDVKKLDALIKKLIKCGEIKYANKHLGFPAIAYLAQCAGVNADFINAIPDYEKYSVNVPDFYSKHNIRS